MDESYRGKKLSRIELLANEIEKNILASGEVVETPLVHFEFNYLSDPAYLTADPFLRVALDSLNLPQVTQEVTREVIKDLRIKQKIKIYTVIANDENRSKVIPSLGIGGFASKNSMVECCMDLTHPNLISSLQTWKRRQLAHELNHVARFQTYGFKYSLFDQMVSEGIATYYEEHWGGSYLPTPWGHAVPPEQLVDLLPQAKISAQTSNYTYELNREWFFGMNQKYPKWTGYSLGLSLVERYMHKHPNTPMHKLVRISTKDLLQAINI